MDLLQLDSKALSDFQHILVSSTLMESGAISLQTREWGYIFPLYLYPETNGQQTIDGKQKRTPNLNKEIVEEIEGKLGLTFTNEKESTKGTFAPIDLLDYIYAVLHSPTYRGEVQGVLENRFSQGALPKKCQHVLATNKAWVVSYGRYTYWKALKLSSTSPPTLKTETTPLANLDMRMVKSGSMMSNTLAKCRRLSGSFTLAGYQPAQKWLKGPERANIKF